MGAWGTAIFSDDLAEDIRSEYNALLSIGKDGHQAEKMLIDYYSDILNKDSDDEPVFWFALALSEWKKGRLSELAKSKALFFLDSGKDLERWNTSDNQKNYKKRMDVLKNFKDTILSPMPPAKKIRKPTVHHCPWKVGSLLAYRIVTNKAYLSAHPCFMKYALLRVIKIDRSPISRLVPNECYDESMLVGLYGWIGDELPEPDIVKHLNYIPVEDYTPTSPINQIDLSLLDCLPEESRNKVGKALNNLSKRVVETCVQLDWVPTKDENGDITFLDCDENFEKNIPDFFNFSISSYSLTHFLPFDVTLAKRLEPFLHS